MSFKRNKLNNYVSFILFHLLKITALMTFDNFSVLELLKL